MRVNICYGGFEKKENVKVVQDTSLVIPACKSEPVKNDFKYKLIQTITVAVAMIAKPAFAAENTMATKMMIAFQPVIDLMQAVSYPTAFIMMGSGLLLVMCGNKHKGIQTMKWATIGYIGMQFLPGLMKLLFDAGQLMGI